MSKNIDEIIDRLIKGGRGSGVRGHKSGPASDTKREIDPDKKKKILASDKRSAKKEVKDHSPEELQSKIDSHKEMSENKFLSPASRESYAAKHKALVAHQKKQGKVQDIKRPEVGIASRPGPFGNINKGGPGSGKKGHSTSRQMTSGTSAQRNFDFNEKFKHAPVNKDIKVESPDESLWHHGDIPKGSKISNLAGGMHVKFPQGHPKENHGHSEYGVKINSHETNVKAVEEGLKKGGPGSGKKGHTGVTPDKSTRERNKQKAGDALQTSRDAKRIIAQLDLSKEDLKELRDYAAAEGITPSQFVVNNKDHIMSNLKKGGPGSGKKGHKTSGKIEPKHFEPNANLRDKNKDLDRLTPEQSAERKKKKEEAQNQARKERLKERADAAHKRGDMAEYEKLITQVRKINPYKGNPASEAVSPTSHGTKPAGEGRYGVGGGKFASPAHEGASAAMNDRRKANTEKYLKQLKSSLSLESDPERKASFEKDIKEIEGELGRMKMKKSLETLFYMNQLAEQGRLKPKQKRNMRKGDEAMEKVLPALGAKGIARVVQNAVKSPDAGKGSDKVPGGPGGPSAAAGGGTGKGTGSEAPKISKSFAQRLDEMYKGGIGSGRKGHHSIGQDYSDESHDSVFEDSRYDSTQEREIFRDSIKEALDREEKRADQRIKEKESTAKRGVSRKPKKEASKKSLLQRLGQAIIDKI